MGSEVRITRAHTQVRKQASSRGHTDSTADQLSIILLSSHHHAGNSLCMPDRHYVFPHVAGDPVPGNWRTFPFGMACSERDSGDGVADSGGGSEILRRKGNERGTG